MTTTVNATLPQDDTYVKMVEYATNLKLTECRVGKAEAVPTILAIDISAKIFTFCSFIFYFFPNSKYFC